MNSLLMVTSAIGLSYSLIFWKLYCDQFRINASWKGFDRENEEAIQALEAEIEEKENTIADLETKVAALEKVVDTVRGAVKP